LHSTPNIEVLKLRRVRCAGHVARMGDRSVAYRVLVGKHKRKNHLEDLGVEGNIVLK